MDVSCSEPLSDFHTEQIVSSIYSAIDFLRGIQSSDGFWRDFNTRSSGISDEWVTGYIGYNLICSTKNLLNCGFEIDITNCINSAVNALSLIDQKKGWGYNQKSPVDADSTANCLLFLREAGNELNDYRESIKLLLKHQGTDGGFSTYNGLEIKQYLAEKDTSFKSLSYNGWRTSSSCVTPIVTKLLISLQNPTFSDVINKSMTYLKNNKNKNGSWKSYWWNSDIYATYNCISLLAGFNPHKLTLINSYRWMENLNKRDGSWICESNGDLSPFFTALSVSTLSLKENNLCNFNVKDGIYFLLNCQHSDGSWSSSPILKIPHPDFFSGSRNEEISKNGTRYHEDCNRAFTTATCLFTLSYVLKMSNRTK